MYSFIKRKAAVQGHWIAFADSFSISPMDFYAALRDRMDERKVPGLELRHIEFAEGGIISDQRTYLRLVRERLVFDICACPFGTGYFFSCRSSIIPSVIRPIEVFAMALLLSVIFYLVIHYLGFFRGLTMFTVFGIAAMYVARNALALGLRDVDRALVRTPVVGPFYEAFIRRETYYREDTRLMYLDLVPRIVKGLAEDTTGEQGLKLVREYTKDSIFGSLYAPVALGGDYSARPPIAATLKGSLSRERIETPNMPYGK